MRKSSVYTRKLTDKDIKALKQRYSRHMKRTRMGFLSTAVKEQLLYYKNWPEETTTQEISQYFYEIREHAKAAIDDFRLLSEVLTESEFQHIFGEKIEGDLIIEELNNQTYTTKNAPRYPISLFFETLVPKTIHLKDGAVTNEIKEQQEWRKEVLEEITLKALDWYFDSGIITTDVHKRLLVDTADVIGLASSGKKPYVFRPDSPMYASRI